MKLSQMAVAFTLFATVLCLAQSADVTLTDGRILKNATILSQTPRTIIIKHATGLCSVSKNLLPRELSTQYAVDETAAREAELKAEQARIKARAFEVAESERLARICTQREANTKQLAEKAVQEKANHESVELEIKKRAETHFRTGFDQSNPAKRISEIRVTIMELSLVDGSNERWFVRGQCDIISSEIVKLYPPFSPAVCALLEGYVADPFDHTPRDVPVRTTQTRPFEAYYSTENARPTFEVIPP